MFLLLLAFSLDFAHAGLVASVSPVDSNSDSPVYVLEKKAFVLRIENDSADALENVQVVISGSQGATGPQGLPVREGLSGPQVISFPIGHSENRERYYTILRLSGGSVQERVFDVKPLSMPDANAHGSAYFSVIYWAGDVNDSGSGARLVQKIYVADSPLVIDARIVHGILGIGGSGSVSLRLMNNSDINISGAHARLASSSSGFSGDSLDFNSIPAGKPSQEAVLRFSGASLNEPVSLEVSFVDSLGRHSIEKNFFSGSGEKETAALAFALVIALLVLAYFLGAGRGKVDAPASGHEDAEGDGAGGSGSGGHPKEEESSGH
ncbi:Uncharacterised protein [uncultured archaeon]|nr:Uncharacterised protein [uncultured archaeon]